MKRRHWLGFLLLGGILLGLSALPSTRRTALGRMLRFLSGHSGGQQAADDLAEALAEQVGRSRFRGFVDDVLETHRSPGRLEASEIPATIRRLSAEQPFTAEVCSLDPQATYLYLSWGLVGIYAGRVDFTNPPQEWYLHSVQPGIFVYFREH